MECGTPSSKNCFKNGQFQESIEDVFIQLELIVEDGFYGFMFNLRALLFYRNSVLNWVICYLIIVFLFVCFCLYNHCFICLLSLTIVFLFVCYVSVFIIIGLLCLLLLCMLFLIFMFSNTCNFWTAHWTSSYRTGY